MQAPPPSGVRDLPAPVSAALNALVSSACDALGPELKSIVLFGTAAENRLRPASDVNVAVVLAAFDADRVGSLSDVLLAARAAVNMNVMWLLEAEIPRAAEAFALKFADIGRRHRVLWGNDPFDGVAIARHVAIARLRQVLMNLVMRLRAGYALHSRHEERLVLLLANAAGPLRASAAEIIELEGAAPPPPREALERLSATLPAGEWDSTLGALSEARANGALEPGTAAHMSLKVIDLACELLRRTDRLVTG